MQRMFAFSESAGRWLPAQNHANGPLELDRLRVATYNVWFDPFELKRRCAAVLSILADEAADVIALEEVTQPFLSTLLATPWVRAQYQLSRDHVDPTLRYDVVMMSRFPARYVAHGLTSIMGRRMHTLEYDTTLGSLAVAGVHLESMRDMTPTRLKQIDECLPVLERAQNAIWLGDFNAAPESEEDARIREHFADSWADLESSPGYTRDTTRNTMLARIKDDRHQRIDRIFVKSTCFVPEQIRLLGTAPLENSAGEVFPSDHFGLVAEFRAAIDGTDVLASKAPAS
jgi:endonuclease/exonuclease/phosphatase family metal-dependent hydrolase